LPSGVDGFNQLVNMERFGQEGHRQLLKRLAAVINRPTGIGRHEHIGMALTQRLVGPHQVQEVAAIQAGQPVVPDTLKSSQAML